MAIIVQHIKEKSYYILLGSSYSFFKDSRPSFLGGNLFPYEEEGELQVAAVSNEKGEICWFPTRDLKVATVDGENPRDILSKYQEVSQCCHKEEDSLDGLHERCPGCGQIVCYDDKECPSCGLTLILEEV